jgi:hypothetical protein
MILFVALCFVQACFATVGISEIMYNGPLGGKQSYIELYNNETSDVRFCNTFGALSSSL